jgi:dolichyl-phosphate-mannose-protein mannosyltransferase
MVRLWGIGYGLPWLFYFHDEPQVVLRALRFGTGDWNPHFFIWPASLLLELTFLAYLALFGTGLALGWWRGVEGFASAYFRDPTIFYLLPRLLTVAVGVWTVALAQRLGRAAYSPAVGLAAALGLALNALHGHYSHFVHPVTWMTAFTVLGLWAACRVAAGGTFRHLALAATACGLGTASQYHAGLLAAPIAVALLYRLADAAPRDRAAWLARGLAAAAIAVAVFLLVSPFVVLDFATFRDDLQWIRIKTEGRLAGGAALAPQDALHVFFRRCLLPGLGTPLAAAGALGAGLALVRRTPADVILLSFVAAYLALASRAGVFNDRYAIPVLVPALLLGARAIEALGRGAGWEARRLAWALPAAILLLGLPGTVQLIETEWTMTRADTRVDALHWFEAHVPAGEPVLIDMLQFWNSASPPLAENRTRLEERIAEVERGVSGAGHSAAYLPYYRYKLAHPALPAYYLRSTNMGAAAGLLDTLRSGRFRWAVVSGEALEAHRQAAAQGDSTGYRYYFALERDAERVAEFRPERWRRLGPVIRIYRLPARRP